MIYYAAETKFCSRSEQRLHLTLFRKEGFFTHGYRLICGGMALLETPVKNQKLSSFFVPFPVFYDTPVDTHVSY